jgi:hypothetical protein
MFDAKANINGRAIAIGHPLGGSGARLTTTLLNNLEQVDVRFAMRRRMYVGLRCLRPAPDVARMDEKLPCFASSRRTSAPG